MNDRHKNASAGRQDPAYGRRLQILSYIVGGIGGLILFFTAGQIELGRGIESVIWGIGLFGLYGFCHELYRRGQRHLQGSADDVVALDRRPRVLYLRSFDDDYAVSIEEEILADILDDVGPFIAIGRPEDKLPPLGASRKYLPVGPWKPHVLNLLNRASLVVLLAGKTEGLAWEMAQCRRRLDPKQLVVLVQRDRAAYEEFIKRVQAEDMSIVFPSFPDQNAAPHHAGQFCGLVRFDERWNGRFEPFQKAAWIGKGHEITTRETGMENRLRLAFSGQEMPDGQAVTAPGRNWLKMGFVSYIVFLVLFLLVFVFLGLTGELD